MPPKRGKSRNLHSSKAQDVSDPPLQPSDFDDLGKEYGINSKNLENEFTQDIDELIGSVRSFLDMDIKLMTDNLYNEMLKCMDTLRTTDSLNLEWDDVMEMVKLCSPTRYHNLVSKINELDREIMDFENMSRYKHERLMEKNKGTLKEIKKIVRKKHRDAENIEKWKQAETKEQNSLKDLLSEIKDMKKRLEDLAREERRLANECREYSNGVIGILVTVENACVEYMESARELNKVKEELNELDRQWFEFAGSVDLSFVDSA